jgi:hypothetical protein
MASKKYSKTKFYDFDTKSQLKVRLTKITKLRQSLSNISDTEFKKRYELKGITRKGKIASYLKMEKEIRANLNRR